MSPTHGEAARRVAERLSHVSVQNRGPEVMLRFNMSHVSTLLQEHGEMVQLLRECVHFASPDGFTRIHVHAFLRKLDGQSVTTFPLDIALTPEQEAAKALLEPGVAFSARMRGEFPPVAKLDGSPEPEAEPVKFEAGDRVYIRPGWAHTPIEGRVAHPVGATGSVLWDGSDCHTVHAASDFEDGTIQRVPVPEPAKLPAAPKSVRDRAVEGLRDELKEIIESECACGDDGICDRCTVRIALDNFDDRETIYGSPAAPNVEVGQVWRTMFKSLWFIAEVDGERARGRSTRGPDCWWPTGILVETCILVSSPDGDGI